ncbi:hypothetical protein M406DRAFT_69916 [Cryphonectria parasitica EP155]|uniref:Alpha/beta hydrolase fold-3 domain-containing protein n=1 Tax=Cryphonectria parasitica (strain ATCC 38755 / EP155) TaxID=660469 RepID=A0A9P4Y7I9_CRYP1|nr:uncharacterized protein M406DRAFT_69916 [Cryphonectria parasitica EP155]KAF3767802.1 hypothetical protein M406DRAFT_69916 [Cryphonectria parasitica EP155]
MSSHTRPRQATAREILSLLSALPLLAFATLTFFLTSSWLQWRDGTLLGRKSLRRNAMASFGTVAGALKPGQLRTLFSRTTGQAVIAYCTKKGLAHQSVLVKESGGDGDGFSPATLHFIDCELEQDGPILLYFHGGGFLVPLQSPAFAIKLAITAGASPVLLEYALAPDCVYPGQLAQALAALRLLLQYRHPSDIIIGGESAGGNLVLAVLAHLQQPKPGLAPLVLPSSSSSSPSSSAASFRGAFAISPRTANDGTADSFQYNAGKDFMSRTSLGMITAAWKPARDVWAAPVLAPEGFWDHLKADRMLLIVGGDEVYRSDVCRVAKVMGAVDVGVKERKLVSKPEKESDPALQLIVCPGEMHCQASLDTSLGIVDGYMVSSISQWLSEF